jgi:hypothetical protein
MKKFLGILAIAGVLVACDNAGDSEKRTQDSLDSVRKADSIAKLNTPVVVPTTPDTNVIIGADTSKPATGDTTKH